MEGYVDNRWLSTGGGILEPYVGRVCSKSVLTRFIHLMSRTHCYYTLASLTAAAKTVAVSSPRPGIVMSH